MTATVRKGRTEGRVAPMVSDTPMVPRATAECVANREIQPELLKLRRLRALFTPEIARRLSGESLEHAIERRF
jgi:hypothetical protein